MKKKKIGNQKQMRVEVVEQRDKEELKIMTEKD
jgi:hypothetical protein